MKKVSWVCLVCTAIILFCTGFGVCAQHSGGGGSFGSAKNEQEQNEEEPMTEDEASGMVMQLLQIVFFGGTPITAYIVYERKLSKSARASKKIMNMLDQKDNAWKFKSIMPRFKEIFGGVKSAWSKSMLDIAAPYTTADMLEKLKMQHAWSDMRQQSSELKYVKLLDARPVAVFDSYDDVCDHIWFYVEWSAVENMGKYDSAKTYVKHKEFWQLMRCNDIWSLSDILDKETGDKLIFGEEFESQQINGR